MSENSQERDIFEQILDKNLAILQDCQAQNGLQSCSQCEKILDCQTRDKYVKAVFESMSKGSTGDFEF
ncbi:hypothetical protein OFN98_00630 [Campylobacter sp. JMF_15 NE4]|uniref:hypothetical protein n=1 Tax=Campylobacter sp. JMF_15 NE4 TaxID=2983825 RepID=UPI0022E9D2AB|nr:hypothetical protein [Campylobacter sp. JMF_15 NE4]MDA3048871.1 hypothetical protein [Campylobacter sp. JMF_15 NE4]